MESLYMVIQPLIPVIERLLIRRVHSLCGNNTKQRGERGWNGTLKLDTYVNKHDLLFQWNLVA